MAEHDPGLGRVAPFTTLHARGVLAVLAVTTVFAAFTASECHNYLTSRLAGISVLPSLLFGLVMWIWWGAIAAGLWMWARFRPAILRFSTRSFLLHLISGSALAVLHLFFLQQTLRIAGDYWPEWGSAYAALNYQTLPRFGIDLALYGFVYAISAVLNMQTEIQQNTVQKLELEKRLSLAQLKALQMQMEPHFLFNTLNAITTLVDLRRNEEASGTLAHLNTILRTTLQRRAPEKVPFIEELKVIESYLAIQQVRFADRLHVRIDIAPEALDGLVPCFLLQPIVENAVQHGIAPMKAGGLIETQVKRVGDTLWMQVRDNGAGPESPLSKGHGIGIQNTRERLAFFYPGTHQFVATSPEGGGFEVTIQIPYESVIA
ncbi:sensor histidine kinase [Granulicella sp. L60]|uniref:sensor histidine kinase n=1 Tax=Granulicella sp. L60 TaxID=1641866 RepID=UPI00131DA52D|nr:sensor histidine kinase [Granulicella sp. L60]